jgi:hypothetical protein
VSRHASHVEQQPFIPPPAHAELGQVWRNVWYDQYTIVAIVDDAVMLRGERGQLATMQLVKGLVPKFTSWTFVRGPAPKVDCACEKATCLECAWRTSDDALKGAAE